MTKAETNPYTKDENGKFKANVGTYYLAGAYGGYKVEKIVSETGAVSDPIRGGYMTKRELYNVLWAFINGMEEGEFQKHKEYNQTGNLSIA